MLASVSPGLWRAAFASEDGETLFAAGRYPEARVAFQHALATDPDHARAHYFLAQIQSRSGVCDSALGHMEKAVAADRRSIEYRLALASLYGQKTRQAMVLAAPGWARKWLRALQSAHQLDTTNVEARRRLVQYYLHAPGIGGGDKRKAIDLARASVAVDGIEGRLMLADALRRAGRPEQSIIEYRAVLERHPGNSGALRGLGYLFLGRDDFDAARGWFDRARESSPGDAANHEALADYFTKRGRDEEAIASLREALSLDSSRTAVRMEMARLYESHGRKEEAIRELESFLRLAPCHAAAAEARKQLKRLRR